MEELKDYVKDMRKQGYSSESIKTRLDQEGFHEAHVEEAFKGSHPLNVFIGILITVFLLVGLGVGIYQLWPSELAPSQVLCLDRECMTGRATQCLPTAYKQKESSSLVEYSIDGCKLQKKVIDIDDIEPAVIKNYFLGKSMVCKFSKNEFKSTWLLGITSDMSYCYGDLKDAVELVI